MPEDAKPDVNPEAEEKPIPQAADNRERPAVFSNKSSEIKGPDPLVEKIALQLHKATFQNYPGDPVIPWKSFRTDEETRVIYRKAAIGLLNSLDPEKLKKWQEKHKGVDLPTEDQNKKPRPSNPSLETRLKL